RVKAGEFSPVELAGGDTVVDVAELAQALVDRDRAGGEHAPRPRIAQEPAREVDVVHRAVEKNPAAGGREADEKSRRIVHIEILRAHQERRAYQPRLDLVVGIAIAGIEAAAVADRHLELGPPQSLPLHALAVGHLQRQRLFAEHVLARLQALDDLRGMQRRRRDQEYRFDFRVGQHRRVFGVAARDAELLLRPGELFGDGAAGGDQVRARRALREILGVAAAQATQARDADAQAAPGVGRWTHSSMIRRSRHDRVAASASSSALTPSAIVVLTGSPPATASMKCVISLAYATR